MIRSKFRFWAYILVILLASFFILCGVPIYILGFNEVEAEKGLIFPFMILLIMTLWLFFGELRSKAIAVEIGGDFVTYSGFLGLAKSKTRRFKYFDGYKTSILPAKGKNYEYLYLIRNNRKIVKISEFYHSNYHELKLEIAGRMVNIGFEEPSLLTEIKEIFR